MARKKVINKGQNQDLIGGSFTNDASKTVFGVGDFFVESNFTGRKTRDYASELASFVTPVTLEDIGLNLTESDTIALKTENVELNLDNSDLKSYIRYGSTREFIRVALNRIIDGYPYSLYVSNSVATYGNITVENYNYDVYADEATFEISSEYIINNYELIFDRDNLTTISGEEIKNLNVSFTDYVIWRQDTPNNNTHKILGFTGDTANDATVYITVKGDPFSEITGVTGNTSFHLKPSPEIFNKFLSTLDNLDKYMLSDRISGQTGFQFELKNPTLLENGEIIYTTQKNVWKTVDGYNPEITGGRFNTLYESLLTIGDRYDEVKTDLIARFLTPSALKVYDTTKDSKMTKLFRIYGAEFDKLRQLIDSLVNINKVTYDKKGNIPDTLVKNLAKTLGWDVFTLVSEKELVESFFSTDMEDIGDNMIPAEIDIELWRRILINTAYVWKSKGTRDAIKSMFLMIGIPEPFINITEYVYTVSEKINPDNVNLSIEDLPSASFPFNDAGYPIAPVETPDFYFQISGNSDSGQEYINNFRNVGFNLSRTVDNKKSWVYETGRTERIHYTTPNYFQEGSELIVNTKEVDVTLDLARGIEYDVYLYNKEVDDPLTSTGFTSPYIYINVPFDYGSNTNVFTIPDVPLTGSSIQVSFNGVTLTPTGSSSGDTGGDYYVSGPQEITLTEETAQIYSNGEKDLITLTYLYDKLGTTGYTNVQYLIQAPVIGVGGTALYLPEEPKGDVQLIIDGITMTKGTSLFTGDFIIDSVDRTKIIIQNASLQQYLQTNPVVRLWYIVDDGAVSNAEVKSEAHRVDSLSSAKLFYNAGIDKFVYVMDLAAYDVDSIKVTVNGLTLQNTKDFTLNPSNKKQIFLTNRPIRLGDVIGVYYVIDGGITITNNDISFIEPNIIDFGSDNVSFFKAGNAIEVFGSTSNDGLYTISATTATQIFVNQTVVNESSGNTITVKNSDTGALLPADDTFPDIQDMSFLEYLELIQRRLINVRTRKTISNFNGGYYPTVLEIYDNYLRRSLLDSNDPLLSNGYTFTNLYPFINQYNAFFNKFINQILSSTIILKKGGILLRNTSFTKQKFMYRRGVNFNEELQWLGTDGAEYIKTLPTTTCEWTTDSVCVSPLNVCANFFLGNVLTTEEDPLTSTTTTAPPVVEQATLIAVGGSSSGSEIWKSTDSGINWTKISTTGGYAAQRVRFFDANTGVAVGTSGTVWRTTNAGANWTLIGDPQSLTTKIHPEAVNTLRAVGVSGSNMIVGGVGDEYFRSTDSGANWTKVPSAGGLDQLSYDIELLNSSIAVSFSNQGTGRILRSTNSGANWTDVDGGLTFELRAAAFNPDNKATGITAGENSRFTYITTNSGATWTQYSEMPEPNGRTPSIYDIKYTSGNVIYALGERDGTVSNSTIVLFKSTDGGVTWIDFTAAISDVITNNENGNNIFTYNMTWADDNVGWIIVSDGRVLSTENGGLVWVETTLPSVVGTTYDIIKIA